ISDREAHLSICCREKAGLQCLKSHFLDVERFGPPRSWAGSAAVIPDVFMTRWYDVRSAAAPPLAGHCRQRARRRPLLGAGHLSDVASALCRLSTLRQPSPAESLGRGLA